MMFSDSLYKNLISLSVGLGARWKKNVLSFCFSISFLAFSFSFYFSFSFRYPLNSLAYFFFIPPVLLSPFSYYWNFVHFCCFSIPLLFLIFLLNFFFLSFQLSLSFNLRLTRGISASYFDSITFYLFFSACVLVFLNGTTQAWLFPPSISCRPFLFVRICLKATDTDTDTRKCTSWIV